MKIHCLRDKMNQFEIDEFLMHQSRIEDLKPGNLLGGFLEISTSDGIATSSVADVTDGYFYKSLFLDQNVPSSADLRESLIFDEKRFVNLPNESSDSSFSSVTNTDRASSLTTTTSSEMDSPEVPEFSSDMVLNYISQILMEENVDDKFDVYPENPGLLAAEKPFYDILSAPLFSSPDQNSVPGADSSDDIISEYHVNTNESSVNGVLASNGWPYGPLEYQQLQTDPFLIDHSSQSSFSPTDGAGNVNGTLGESIFSVDDLITQSTPAWQFHKGVEEAHRFLPSNEQLVIDLEANGFRFSPELKEVNKMIEIKAEKERIENNIHEPRGRKTQHYDDLDLQEGRSNKQQAFSNDETIPTEILDNILLRWNKCSIKIDEKQAELENGTGKSSSTSHAKGSSGGKGRGKKKPKDVVDLRTLLIHCAQSVAIDDRRSANELLKQIRQYSSRFGDANQRLAHCFANGLEARLAGTGSQIYDSFVAKRISTVDMLKAYQCYMSACPFKKIAYFFSNSTILNVAKDATRLHIIDFGIYHGFQWPCFMQRLASRSGGPPSLRMTGIDIPRPGFRPTERIDETGNRLADYAHRFGVPFKFHAIATKEWESIRIEDLKIDKDELLVVNGLFQFNSLMDETVIEDSPRNMVLNTIKSLNPAVYIFGSVNGSYNSPFFITRFREVLFYYSSSFDMIETNVPRDDESRLLIEENILGRDALNVIACEGPERVERPETYKQWQLRHLRLGFKQLPLSPETIKTAKEKLKNYHKDFVIDVDGKWLLQGWKGRITQCLTTWVSNESS